MEITANVLTKYFTTFFPVLNWFSDQGTHFLNKIIFQLTSNLGVKHRYSTVYAPRSNETVESVCKEILRVMRAFCIETRTPEADWPKSVPAVQRTINNSPTCRLNGLAPITVHTGIKPGNPLNLALSGFSEKRIKFIDEVQLKHKLLLQDLFDALDAMHRDVSDTLSKARKQVIESHNAKIHVTPYKSTQGDYVLVK